MEQDTILRTQIATEAADWFARLHDSQAAPAERAEFAIWLLRSPEHIREYLALAHAASELRFADEDEFSVETLVREARAQPATENVIALTRHSVEALKKPAGGAKTARVSRLWIPLAAAAAVLLIIGGIAGLWPAMTGWMSSDSLRTAIGEQRSVTLTDGSIVHLNTGSEVRIELDAGERRIQLLRGEARFTVAKDPTRPFVVVTQNASVRALGTVFNVLSIQKQTAVAVLEGRVEVVSRAESQASRAIRTSELSAGERAAVNRQGDILAEAGPPLERVREWTERRLVFREERLADLVAEINRYHEHPLRIGDPSLVDLKISGSFAANDLASLLEYLERYERVHSHRDADGSPVLTR